MKLKKSDDYFFDSSNEVRAAFELGIKFGALYHTSIGRPIRNDPETVHQIEQGIAASISCQPYVKSVSVKILGDLNSSSEFKYGEITGSNMQAEIVVNYKDIKITGRLEWIDELNYPLMYISDIRKQLEE
jgi:hypothetical protein